MKRRRWKKPTLREIRKKEGRKNREVKKRMDGLN